MRRMQKAVAVAATILLITTFTVPTARGFTFSSSTSSIRRNRQRLCASDWLVENLESTNSSITSISSSNQAGENDTLPEQGLVIGNMRILAARAVDDSAGNATISSENLAPAETRDLHTIRLLLGRNGWGTGVHPTTRLCLDWLCKVMSSSQQQDGIKTVVDYGCGSGILSIAALHLGANRSIGVDIEAEALVTAERNVKLNGYRVSEYSDDNGITEMDDTNENNNTPYFQGLHTRQVLPYELATSRKNDDGSDVIAGADIIIANILIGQLTRPSMVAALVSNLKPKTGLLCLSGIRPNQVDALKAAYSDSIEWMHTAELSASETPGSVESYGFDCGQWSRVVGRRKNSITSADIQAMSELAVS